MICAGTCSPSLSSIPHTFLYITLYTTGYTGCSCNVAQGLVYKPIFVAGVHNSGRFTAFRTLPKWYVSAIGIPRAMQVVWHNGINGINDSTW